MQGFAVSWFRAWGFGLGGLLLSEVLPSLSASI